MYPADHYMSKVSEDVEGHYSFVIWRNCCIYFLRCLFNTSDKLTASLIALRIGVPHNACPWYLLYHFDLSMGTIVPVLVMEAYGGEEVQRHFFFTSVLDGTDWTASRPVRFNLRKEPPRFPSNRSLGGPPNGVWETWIRGNLLHLSEIEPRFVGRAVT